MKKEEMIDCFDDNMQNILRTVEYNSISSKNKPKFIDILIEIICSRIKQNEDELFWRKKLDELDVQKYNIDAELSKYSNDDVDFDKIATLEKKYSDVDIILEAKRRSQTCLSIFSSIKFNGDSNKAVSMEENDVLPKFSINLNELTYYPLIGRDKELGQLEEVILRRKKANAILIGEAGVGKTAIVEGLAQNISKRKCSKLLEQKIILQLNLAEILAGTRYRGDFEERLISVLDEVVKNREKYIVFFDEIHTIVKSGGGEGGIDAGNILKPYLARGEIIVIGATTVEEYSRDILSDHALARRFYPIFVKEPSLEETRKIIQGIKAYYEEQFSLHISSSLLDYIIVNSYDKVHFRKQPDKSIDILELSLTKSIRQNKCLSKEIIDQTILEYIENFSLISKCKEV